MSGESRSVDGLDPAVRARRAADEVRIGRLLIGITYVAVAVLVVGVVVMLVSGVSPLDDPPTVDPATFLDALRALRPEAILLIGVGLVIATPIIRVAAAAVSYVRSGELAMVLVSLGILAVIVIGVASAALTGGPRG